MDPPPHGQKVPMPRDGLGDGATTLTNASTFTLLSLVFQLDIGLVTDCGGSSPNEPHQSAFIRP
jgi:hypothetical protein